jgi:hypothetical protein
MGKNHLTLSYIMKKFFAYSALCATIVAATSCGGNEVNEVAEPVEEPTAWQDVNAFDTNDVPTGMEVTNFGQNGQIVSVDKFVIDKETKKSIHTEHIIYQDGKPALGKMLKEDGTVEGREVYNYNTNGYLAEQVIETYSEGLKRIAPSMRYVYTYNGNDDLVSIKEQKTAPKGWKTEYEWTYDFDELARVYVRADFTGEGKERKQSCRYDWKYEEGSNKIAQLDYFFFDLKVGKLKHDSKTMYKYNAAGQVTEELIIRHKNNLKRDDIKSRRFSYEYNAAGQLKSIYEEKWNNSVQEWAEVCNTLYDYDKAGQLVKWSSNKYTTKGAKFMHEVHTYGGEKPTVAPAAPSMVIKPIVNLDDKHLTSKEED